MHKHSFLYTDEKGSEWVMEESTHSHVSGDTSHYHDGVHGSKHKLAIRGDSFEKKYNKKTKNH